MSFPLGSWQRRDFFRSQAQAAHAAAIAAAAAAAAAADSSDDDDDNDGDAVDPSTLLTAPDDFDFDAAAARAQYDYVEDVHSSVESLRAHALLSCQVGFLGIFLMIAAREVEWSYDSSSSALNVALALRCLNSCVTLYLLYLIYRYNWIENHIDNINAGFLNELSFWSNKRLTSLAIEFIICAIHDFPFLDLLVAIDLPIDQNDYLSAYFGIDIVPVAVPAPWSLFMFLRFYLIGRVMRDRAFSSGANILGMFSNFPFNTEFAIRAILDGDAMPTLLQFLFLLQVACAYSLHVCERPADFGNGGIPGNKSFTGAVWLSFVTLTTVGYGDLLPLTLCGRGVMLLNAFIGLCLMSGILSAFNGMITMLPFESRMEDFIAFDVVKWHFWNSASSVIAHAWRNYKARKAASFSMLQAGANYLIHHNFVHAINRFYDARISFNSYDGRYHGSAYLLQCLRVMLRRASLCANLTFGDDREATYVDNFIVNQMAIILTRDVAENKVQSEEARFRAILDAHHERIRAGIEDEDDESVRSSDSERSEEEEEIEGMPRKVTRPLDDYELLRRRIQRRQRLVASSSTFTGTGKRRLFSFRFRDGPSALQKRLVHIRSQSVGARSGDFFSVRGDHESSSSRSSSWEDEQRPAILPEGKHHLDIQLYSVDHDASSSSRQASSRPLSARSPKQNLVRYGSIRPADVLQFIINTPAAKALPEPIYVPASDKLDSREARDSSQFVDSDPLALDGPVLQVGDPADSQQPATTKPKRLERIKIKRRVRAPGEHHHHHHLHGNLPPPPLVTPVPHLVESTVRVYQIP